MPIPFRFGTKQAASEVLFIFATGGDGPTQQKLVSLLTRTMEASKLAYSKLYKAAGKTPPNWVSLVPQPTWQPSDYITACIASRQPAQRDNSRIAGALMVGIDQISTYTKTAIILRDNHTMIDATLFYAACDPPSSSQTSTAAPVLPLPNARHVTVIRTITPPSSTGVKGTQHGTNSLTTKIVTDYAYATPTPNPNPSASPKSPYYIQWKTDVQSKDDFSRIWTPLQGIAILMSGVAAWATLTPSVTKSTTNTTVFSTPIPGNPIPPGGVVTQSQTGNSKVTNASQFSGFAAGFLSSSLTYEGQVTGIPTTDWQAYNAASDVIDEFAKQMSCPAQPRNRIGGASAFVANSSPCLLILTGNPVSP